MVKVARCSTTEAKAADALSKAAYYKFRELVPTSEKLPRVIPRKFYRAFEKGDSSPTSANTVMSFQR